MVRATRTGSSIIGMWLTPGSARESGASTKRRRNKAAATVRPVLPQVLDAITDAPGGFATGATMYSR
jgi:hypothetical protein